MLDAAKSKRSQVMGSVRSKGNKTTELKLMSILRANSITGWRRHQPLYGHPDFIFRGQRLAVFVDGCFWHGCRWHCRLPKTRRRYWIPKIARNMRRDRAVTKTLREKGWGVLRIWYHSLHMPYRIVLRLRKSLALGNRCY